MSAKSIRTCVVLPADLVDGIDAFQRAHDLSTRSEAIRVALSRYFSETKPPQEASA